MGVCIHDPPRSTGAPARLTVCSRPPIRSRASSTTHSTPPWVRAFATVNPAIPAPTTTTRSTGPAAPAGTSARPSSKPSAVNPATPIGEMPHAIPGAPAAAVRHQSLTATAEHRRARRLRADLVDDVEGRLGHPAESGVAGVSGEPPYRLLAGLSPKGVAGHR